MDNFMVELAEANLIMDEGDEAVLIRAGPNGPIQIHHAIPSVEADGSLALERGDAAGMVMAMSLLELLQNESHASNAAVIRAIASLSGRPFIAVK